MARAKSRKTQSTAYLPAKNWQRILAFLVDCLMIAIPNSLLVWFLTEHGMFSSIALSYNLFVLTVILVYFIFFTYKNDGQTIGKMVMGIQVAGWEKKLTLSMIVVRYGLLFGLIQFDNIYRLITGTSLSLLGVAFQTLSILLVICLLLIDDKRRGVHDMIGKTWVVQVEN